MNDCWYCLKQKTMGITIEQLRGELNTYKNANRQYRKLIKDLTKRLDELELELKERGLNDDK